MHHPKRLAGVTFFVYRDEHGKLLVSVTSDKLFHIAAAPPCAWGFARSLRKTPLQRFHSIINGSVRARHAGLRVIRSGGLRVSAQSLRWFARLHVKVESPLA